MRLSERLKAAIIKAVEQSFGETEVILFGSRVDEKGRGGDIDLAIDSNLTHEQFQKKRAQLFSILIHKGLDLNIDLVQLAEASPLLRSEILNHGIPLR